MAVDFEDDAEGVLDIAHAIGLLARVIFADRHALLAAGGDDLFDQSLLVTLDNGMRYIANYRHNIKDMS